MYSKEVHSNIRKIVLPLVSFFNTRNVVLEDFSLNLGFCTSTAKFHPYDDYEYSHFMKNIISFGFAHIVYVIIPRRRLGSLFSVIAHV